jgi:hypothetical protein
LELDYEWSATDEADLLALDLPPETDDEEASSTDDDEQEDAGHDEHEDAGHAA